MLQVCALGNEEGEGLECEVFQMAGNEGTTRTAGTFWRKSTYQRWRGKRYSTREEAGHRISKLIIER